MINIKLYNMNKLVVLLVIVFTLLPGCNSKKQNKVQVQIEDEITGIKIPENFKISVVADNLGRGRHIVVNDNGDIYMALNKLENGYGIVGIRDNNGDGIADLIRYFGEYTGTGIDIYNGYLYFGSDTVIVRYRLRMGELVPDTIAEIIVSGFPNQDTHESKSITIDLLGNLYVNVGGPSNACMELARTMGSPGIDPCPQLKRQGGIWKFNANKPGQDQMKDGKRYATGIRNAVALKYNRKVQQLYAVQHGRDQLSQLYPDIYTEDDGVNLPAEEFFLIQEGDDFGWPYCYYDPFKVKKVLAPEYGGNGAIVGRCEFVKDPILAFPAHLAPNCLAFYNKEMFPEKYRNGAFIAFHGSWNRAPQEQDGFFIGFVPFNGMYPEAQWEIFADGFAGKEVIKSPREAVYRPMGIAIGPKGEMYISDSKKGKIWCITYQAGTKKSN